jgi:uncharacterized protein (DUF58 family)
VTLKRRRIYILPTRFGVLFAMLVLAMLFGSINYGASLGFALTFLLAGLLLVAMHECHRNLLGLRLRFVGAAPAFAEGLAEFKVALGNDAAAARYEIELERGERRTGATDLMPAETRILPVRVSSPSRGWLTLGRFTVSTSHPGRLFRAWSWVDLEARCLVYPRPAPPGVPAPFADAGGQRASRAGREGEEDFAGLRPATSGDPPKRIAWKAYARSDALLAKQFAGAEHQELVLDWNTLSGLAVETRLSQLTRWCLDAAAEGHGFVLRLPDATLGPAGGDHHLHACLRALALYDGGEKAEG